jgi:hypothetical protein
LPFARASASEKPIPVAPPVISTVLPFVFMMHLLML